MAGDEFRRFNTGDPLDLPARALNAMLDAAEANRSRKGGAGASKRDYKNPSIVHVRNDSDTNCNQFDVLGIDGVVVTPSEDEDSALEQVTLKGVTPDSELHAGKFVICQEPIEAGEVGLAVVSGATWARVHFAADDDEFCDVSDSLDELLSASTGSAQVLYRESEGNPTWALIKIGAGISQAPQSTNAFGPATHRCLDTDGNVQWSSDYGGQSGVILSNTAGEHMAYNGDGILWSNIANGGSTDRIAKFNPITGAVLVRYLEVNAIGAIDADADAVYVLTSDGVRKHDNDYATLWTYNTNIAGGFVHVDATGQVYCGKVGNGFQVLDSSGVLVFDVTTTDAINCIATDDSGNIYAGFNAATDGLRCYDSSGTELWAYASANFINDIQIDSDTGDVVAGGATGINSLHRLASDGTLIWDELTGGAVAALGFDSGGNIYVAIGRNIYASGVIRMTNTLRKYTSSGTLVWMFDGGSSASAGSWASIGLQVDEDDRIFVSGTRTDHKVHPAYFV